MAERFATSRVVLAGDAVHLFTPTGGFGMNTGMDDASNLAWKLAALVQGWGGPNLLQSYEIERKPIAHRNTTAARELNKQLASMPPIDAIDENSPAGEATRRTVSAHLATMTEEYASLGVQLGARYDGSPIIAARRRAAAGRLPERYIPSGVPGGRAPHYGWAPAGDMATPCTTGSALASRCCSSAAGRPAKRSCRRQRERNVPLKVVDVPLPEARDLYGRDLALIRPDQYVAWRGNAPPSDPDRVMGRLVGAILSAMLPCATPGQIDFDGRLGNQGCKSRQPIAGTKEHPKER